MVKKCSTRGQDQLIRKGQYFQQMMLRQPDIDVENNAVALLPSTIRTDLLKVSKT